jgi:uncharacterized protein (TIGR02145 family)
MVTPTKPLLLDIHFSIWELRSGWPKILLSPVLGTVHLFHLQTMSRNGMLRFKTPHPHFAWNSFDQQNKGAPYGAFYNFHTVVDPRGLCPTGWRVPTIDDWEKLIIIIGGHSNAGGKVKSLSPHWQLPNVDATDEIEFGALPGGLISGNGSQIFEGEMAWFWSSTSFDDGFAYAFGTSNTDPILGWSPQPKWDGRNIRCVKE